MSYSLEDNYKRFENKGHLPEDLTRRFSETYRRKVEVLGDRDSDRKDKEAFYNKSTYVLHSLLYSGLVIFNDSLTAYINEVAGIILKEDPKLRSEIRIYLVKSTSVNAFTTNDGMIFVNVALLSQLANEAQLAFILAHEIEHYKRKHVIDEFLEIKKMMKNSGKYGHLSSHDMLVARNNHSRELELEADKEGFGDFYLKSGYDLNEAVNVFDVLKYSYLPFDELTFDLGVFNNKHIAYLEKYFPLEINEIKTGEDFDEELSTHPAPEARQEVILQEAVKQEAVGGKLFQVSEQRFQILRELCRMELCALYNDKLELDLAMYNTWLLLRKYPNNKYLQKEMARCLYFMSLVKNKNQSNRVLRPLDEVEGKSHIVTDLLALTSKEELSTWAISYLFSIDTRCEDNDIQEWMKVLIDLLEDDLDLELASFFTSVDTTTEQLDSIAISKLSNIEKEKYESKLKKEIESEYLYTFVDYMVHDTFSNLFKSLTKKEKSDKDVGNGINEKYKDHDNGTDNLAILSPQYTYINIRSGKKGEIKTFKSEERHVYLILALNERADKLGLNLQTIDINNIKEYDYVKFECYTLAQQWLRLKASLANVGVIGVPLMFEENYNKMYKSFDTDNFCWLEFYCTQESLYCYSLLTNIKNEEVDWFYWNESKNGTWKSRLGRDVRRILTRVKQKSE